MDVLSQIITTILGIPTEVYVYVLGAAGVSIFTQVAKKLLTLQNEKKIILVFTAFSFVAGALEYLVTSPDLPPTILSVSTVAIMGIAQPIYFWFVKPASIFISDVRMYRNQLVSKATEISGQPLEPVVETKPVPAVVPETISFASPEYAPKDLTPVEPLPVTPEPKPATPHVVDF